MFRVRDVSFDMMLTCWLAVGTCQAWCPPRRGRHPFWGSPPGSSWPAAWWASPWCHSQAAEAWRIGTGPQRLLRGKQRGTMMILFIQGDDVLQLPFLLKRTFNALHYVPFWYIFQCCWCISCSFLHIYFWYNYVQYKGWYQSKTLFDEHYGYTGNFDTTAICSL